MYQLWSKSIEEVDPRVFTRIVTNRRKDRRTDSSVAISPRNFVGKGITKTIAKEINNRRKSKRKQQHQTNNFMLILNIFICPI